MNEIKENFEYVNCNLCGKDNFELYLKQQDVRYDTTPRDIFNLVRCKNCGLVYLNPRPTRKYIINFYPSDYDVYRINEKQAHFKKFFNLNYIRHAISLRERYKIINKHHKATGNILDVGPAAGEFLIYMKSKKWQVTGVEISRDMCAYLTSTHRINCVNSGFNDLDLNKIIEFQNKFDVITFWSSFEHLFYPKEALEICKKI